MTLTTDPDLLKPPMTKSKTQSSPADQAQRDLALDPRRSVLVQAPAGSGKTDLLTRRYLRLLSLVEEPGQIVAITFTIAAAAEMRHRILSELEKASAVQAQFYSPEDLSMPALAHRAFANSNTSGWKLLDLPAQLRISTIDSFCRELALQQPLLSQLGGSLEIAKYPNDLYRRAARHVLSQIEGADAALAGAVEQLLRWRDNNWQEIENQLVEMLARRDRWMHDFVVSLHPDWDSLRQKLEQPFTNAIRKKLTEISELLDQVPGAREEALLLARFACAQTNGAQHQALAELFEFPDGPFLTAEALEEAHEGMACLAGLVQTKAGTFRASADVRLGFPADRKAEKARLLALARTLEAVPGLEAALGSICKLPPARYPDEDWQIIRASFTLLRHAAAQLKVVFAEAAAVDFIEVAQIAQNALESDDGLPTPAAIALADGIHHLLVDEFQDTSRRQHRLLASLLGAWTELDPMRAERTCFLVGDPMQSIYFFRDADAELFSRVQQIGLEIPNAEPWKFDFATLSANFRTTKALVHRLNEVFTQVFAENDGSDISFSKATPARDEQTLPIETFKLHLKFCPRSARKTSPEADESVIDSEPDSEVNPQAGQAQEIVDLIRSLQPTMTEAAAAGGKYRIAVLARTRRALAPVAQALHEAAIPFRAVDLEKLGARPEVLDALSLARALLNPYDRVAWLGLLRAPWCALAIDDMHTLTSADSAELLAQPIPDLLAERLSLLKLRGQRAVRHVLAALFTDSAKSISRDAGSLTATPGTWLQQYWLRLGGPDCYEVTAQPNLELLWRCLDALPNGRQDLLGPALPAALNQLTALPNPAASSDCGVHLMTIHKSKGLEFEVVIVPDLQAGTASTHGKLLSWLERGIKPDEQTPLDQDDRDTITEFLVAPLQSKGEDSGKPKAWVDAEYRKRESQELRRILYVAATRAREELHLFARPAYKADDASLTLVEPPGGLLSTAWPALGDEVRTRFNDWKLTRSTEGRIEVENDLETNVETLAASAESGLFAMPQQTQKAKPAVLRRLLHEDRPLAGVKPPSHPLGESAATDGTRDVRFNLELDASRLYARHEGGMGSRALGTAVHTFFEELARLRAHHDWETARADLKVFEPRIAAAIRSAGIGLQQATQIASEALQLVLEASRTAVGQWILSPHAEAASEVRWSGVIGGVVRTVQADRIFKAGLIPHAEGDASWWIIDYKTHAAESGTEAAAALPPLRSLFAPQLEAYARVLRNLHGEKTALRAGIYYPRMNLFDWWQL